MITSLKENYVLVYLFNNLEICVSYHNYVRYDHR